jgi:nucleoprotein TPR
MSTTLETMKEELKNKEEELQLAESRLAGRGQLASQTSSGDAEGKNRKRDVELLLAQTKQELKSVNSQLNEQKRSVEEFKMISETAEKRMLESSKAMADYKAEADAKLKSLTEEKIAAEKKAAAAAGEITELRQRIEDLESEAGASGGEMRERMRTTAAELDAAREKIKLLAAQEQEMRAQMTSLGQEAREAQDKYERELLLHAQNIEKLNKLKAEVSSHSLHVDELEMERARSEAQVKELEQKYAAKADNWAAEMAVLREQLDLAAKENTALLSQLESVSQQLVDVSASGRVLDTSQALNASIASNTSIRSLNEDEANNEQLMSIIKYLRREKEIIAGRLDVAEAEIIRTNQQLEQAVKSAADVTQALELER